MARSEDKAAAHNEALVDTRVDSFLVREGRAIRPDLHRARFGAGYPALDDAPQHGEWFPRVTVSGVVWRPAPRLRTETTLWVPPTPDPRLHPLTKGPDLALLGTLRAEAQSHGADDALLYGEEGVVHEAANAALVFFDEEGPAMGPANWVLESTTLRATVEAGLMPKPRRAEIRLAEALELQAWCASALHGWTRVTRWIVEGKMVQAAAHTADPANTADPENTKTGRINARLWESAVDVTAR